MNKIASGPHLGNPKHHVRGCICSFLLLGCLLIKSVLFLGFWIESVSSVHINGVSHYFYELTFIFFIGHLLPWSQLFCTTTSNMYMMELADSMNFYAIGFSHVSPIEDCLQNCECLSQFRPKLWNMMGIAGNVLPHRIWRHHRSYIPCENLYVSFISNLLMSHGNWARQG